MIQSIALLTLCLSPQFVFTDSPQTRGTKKVSNVAKVEVQPELVVSTQRREDDGDRLTVSISSIAVPKVKLEFFRVDPRSNIAIIAFDSEKLPRFSGKPEKTLTVIDSSAKKAAGPVQTFRKSVKVSDLKPGYYVLRASGRGVTYQTLVPITNLNVLTKKGRKNTLVWVTNQVTGRTEPAAKIEVFDQEGRPVSVSQTNKDGIAWIPTVNPFGKPRAILVGKGRDQTILNNTPSFIRKTVGHIQTDRPLYRPGNKIHFKAFFRKPDGPGYKTPVGERVTYEFRDPQDEVIEKGELKTNSFGSVAGSATIPSEGILGNYSVVFTHEQESFYTTVSCLAYRKPQFKVETSSPKTVFGGERASLQVKAEYLFAAPLPNATVQYTVRREKRSASPVRPTVFEDPGQENLGVSDVYRSNEYVDSGTVRTNNEGLAEISFPTRKDGLDSRYQLEITVRDATNREVQTQGSVEVPAAAVKIGVFSSRESAQLGEQVPITLKSRDIANQPMATKGVLTASRRIWKEKLGREVTEVIFTKEVSVPSTGSLTVNTLAARQGQINYRFEVKDSQGRTSRAETEVEVYGPIPFEESIFNPQIIARVSKNVMKIGENATVLVTSNVRKGPILLTVEGSDLESARVFQPSAKGVKVQFKAAKPMQPGVTLIATQSTKYDFLTDEVTVEVPATDEKLTVKVRPKNKTVRPGEKTTFTVETLDEKGNPKPAELSLKVVDSAIYQLKGENVIDPFRVLWGPRFNEVETTFSRAREVSGGMFQMASGALPAAEMVANPEAAIRVRRNFQDTAFWNAFVTTDRNGKAEVEVPMPDNLTTWRATAVGITTASQAGMNDVSIVATQPFTMRIATPRQIVAGDRLDLTASVNNRTDSPSKLAVTLDLDVQGEKSRFETTVSVPAKGEGTFVVPVNIPKEVSTLGAKVSIRGEARQIDGTDGDAVEEVFPLVPPGVARRSLSAGAFSNTITLRPNLPENRIPGLDEFRLTVWAGVMPVVLEATQGDFETPGWNPPTLAMQIESLARLPKAPERAALPKLFSRLTGVNSINGWGWWPESAGDTEVSVDVAYALGAAQSLGIPIPGRLKPFAMSVLKSIQNENNLPETKALTVSARVLLAPETLDELLECSKDLANVSPYAQSRVAEVLILSGRIAEGQRILEKLKRFVSDGGGRAFLPGGTGLGWSADSTETTGQYLHALSLAKADKELRTQLAQWLLSKAKETYGSRPKAALIRGLTSYDRSSPTASELGDVRVSVNNTVIEGTRRPSGAILIAGRLPSNNAQIALQTSAQGEVFYALESRYFDKNGEESPAGIRVLRRFEVRNEAGQWVELARPVRVNEPLRVSVVAWSDGLSEPIRITEPIPAGFEYADGDSQVWAYEEIKDGAVVHTLVVGDRPLFFRYYLRAESPGVVQALPAILEVLRRGDATGQSATSILKIQKSDRP